MYCFANFVSRVQIPHSIWGTCCSIKEEILSNELNCEILEFSFTREAPRPAASLAHPLLRGKLVSIIRLLLPQINGLEFKPLNLFLPNLQEKWILKTHLYFG